MISCRFFALALTACIPLGCSKSVPSAPEAPQADETVVLGHVWLIDGNGGPPIAHANIVIASGRIEAAGPADQVPVPAGARVIDLRGKSVMPGLISNHSHVGAVNGTAAAEVGSYSITMSTSQETLVTGSTTFTSGHGLRLRVTTAAAGCTTGAANVTAAVTYQMTN